MLRILCQLYSTKSEFLPSNSIKNNHNAIKRERCLLERENEPSYRNPVFYTNSTKKNGDISYSTQLSLKLYTSEWDLITWIAAETEIRFHVCAQKAGWWGSHDGAASPFLSWLCARLWVPIWLGRVVCELRSIKPVLVLHTKRKLNKQKNIRN